MTYIKFLCINKADAVLNLNKYNNVNYHFISYLVFSFF